MLVLMIGCNEINLLSSTLGPNDVCGGVQWPWPTAFVCLFSASLATDQSFAQISLTSVKKPLSLTDCRLALAEISGNISRCNVMAQKTKVSPV